MVFTKRESVKASDFNSIYNIELDYFECGEEHIICHFVRDGKPGTFAAKDWSSLKAMWNYGLF